MGCRPGIVTGPHTRTDPAHPPGAPLYATIDPATFDRECEEIVASATASFEQNVMRAAEAGSARVALMTFDGNAKYGDDASPLLLLIKGPRHRELRYALSNHPPVLARLRALLAPFRVSLEWDRRTNTNTLYAGWTPCHLMMTTVGTGALSIEREYAA